MSKPADVLILGGGVIGLTTAYYLPQMAQIRNPRHLHALSAALAARGTELRAGCPVHGLEAGGGRVSGALTSAGRLVADQYMVSAGAWSDAILAPLGCSIGTR